MAGYQRAWVAGIIERGMPIQRAYAQDKTLTLTGMYNLLSEYRATGTEQVAGVSTLADAHDDLDKAVAAAYGWAWPLSEDEVLSRLLALNLERFHAQQEQAASVSA